MNLPTIRGLSARPVLVPMRRAPVAASGRIDGAPLVLVDLLTADGITGRAYVFAFTRAMLAPAVAMLEALDELVVGAPAAPLALDAVLRRRLTLQDTHGVLGQALAAIDMAAWDAHAQAAGMPLARLLGAAGERVPAYNSCGLWIGDPARLADEAETLVAEGGYAAVKLRLGRAEFAGDLAAVRAVRGRLPDSVHVMSDFNQALSAHEALARCRALDDEGLYWFEEPVRHDDWRNAARVSAAVRTPVQLGENLRGVAEMDLAIAAGAASLYMPDVQRIGGVSGWLRAATLP
ncbi:MAG: enolase C-terminal domain-like protein, partial [Gammaproteobacteria bacterium]